MPIVPAMAIKFQFRGKRESITAVLRNTGQAPQRDWLMDSGTMKSVVGIPFTRLQTPKVPDGIVNSLAISGGGGQQKFLCRKLPSSG
jgi:hypothetical protein